MLVNLRADLFYALKYLGCASLRMTHNFGNKEFCIANDADADGVWVSYAYDIVFARADNQRTAPQEHTLDGLLYKILTECE